MASISFPLIKPCSIKVAICDERNESRKGLEPWVRVIALVTEEVCLVPRYDIRLWKYEIARFS